jgi:hypothetical protein
MGLRDIIRNLKDRVDPTQISHHKPKAQQQQKENGDVIRHVDHNTPL